MIVPGDLGMAVGFVMLWDSWDFGIPVIRKSGDGPWEFLEGKSLGKIFVGRAFLPSQNSFLNIHF